MKVFTYIPGLVWCLLSATQPIQVLSLSFVTIIWSYFAMILNQPTIEDKKEKHDRLVKALEHTGDSGLTEAWYIRWFKMCSFIETFSMTIMLIGILNIIRRLFPQTFMIAAPQFLERQWNLLLESEPDRNVLFSSGLFAAHFYPFWGLAKFYALLDLLKNTKFLKPWKIQTDERLTLLQYAKCTIMAFVNQTISLYLLTRIPFNAINPDMFSPILPSFSTMILSLGTYAVAAEFWFYSFHRLMHKYNFLYNTFHAQHHTITAPSSITAIYANPVEHVVLNFPTLCLGPLICGSHYSLWLLWSFLATISTCHGHSGWHLPFLGSSESHDFHHSYGTENFGTLGVMDKLFHSQKIWNISSNKKVDKTYIRPDYPVDKILAQEKDGGLEGHTCNGAEDYA